VSEVMKRPLHCSYYRGIVNLSATLSKEVSARDAPCDILVSMYLAQCCFSDTPSRHALLPQMGLVYSCSTFGLAAAAYGEDIESSSGRLWARSTRYAVGNCRRTQAKLSLVRSAIVPSLPPIRPQSGYTLTPCLVNFPLRSSRLYVSRRTT
jgi:hypothetical protein